MRQTLISRTVFDSETGVTPSPSPYDTEWRDRRGEPPRGTMGIVLTVLAQAVAKGGVGLVASEERPRRGQPQKPMSG